MMIWPSGPNCLSVCRAVRGVLVVWQGRRRSDNRERGSTDDDVTRHRRSTVRHRGHGRPSRHWWSALSFLYVYCLHLQVASAQANFPKEQLRGSLRLFFSHALSFVKTVTSKRRRNRLGWAFKKPQVFFCNSDSVVWSLWVIVSRVHVAGDGSISFNEFANLMRSYQSYQLSQSCDSLASDALLHDTFEIFDKDHDGFLNAEDLRLRILLFRLTLYGLYGN